MWYARCKPNSWMILVVATALLLLVLSGAEGLVVGTATAQAQSGGGYDLTWWTADGGGGAASGGGYALNGTIGQPDAGALNGGGYTLAGGFWGGGAAASEHNLFLPLILR